jgi:hypothetical protein
VPLNALASLTTAGGAAFDKKFPQGRPAPGSSCDVKSGPAEVERRALLLVVRRAAAHQPFDRATRPWAG